MKEKQEKTPLKISLQNFLNHVEHLESQRNEDTYEKEFQELKNFSEKLKTLTGYSCSEGENEVNKKKNRYKDILPFDSSRVKLTEYVGVPGSNYINANFIRGASGSPAYIASQGPLPHTVNDFWRMVVEWDVQVIVMACSVEEAGKHKCEKYWVDNNEEKQFGNVTVQLVNSCVVCPDYLVRTMLIKYPTSESDSSIVERKVCQYHYVAWPDHGVPSKVRPLVDMVRKVRETQVSETLPVLVHCSAGCGRTGTICAIDYVWGLLRSGRLTKDFSLFNLVRRMRKQRIAMVQTKEQYILVHQAVRELFCDQLRVIDSHPYENIDVNGMPLVKDEEEHTYAAVGSENTDEEKQDEKEKDTVAEPNNEIPPSFPKKRGSATFSKQEKEVENLTEKQRSTIEYSSGSDSSVPSISLCNKPKVERLKALFEVNSATKEQKSSHCKHKNHQQVARSHSLGAICKSEKLKFAESIPLRDEEKSRPIPSQGTLHIPKLRAFQTKHLSSGAKQTSQVKRSKSLKVLNSSDSCNLSVVPSFTSSTRSRCLHEVGSQENVSQTEKISSCHLPHFARPLSLQAVCTHQTEENRLHDSEISAVKILPHKSVNSTDLLDSSICRPLENSISLHRRRSLDSITSAFESLSLETSCDHKCEQLESACPGTVFNKQVKSVCMSPRTSGASPKQSKVTQTVAKDSKVSREAVNEIQSSVKVYSCRHPITDSHKYLSSVPAGLAVRERRNSFHQAVNTSYEMSTKMNDYEPIWLRNTQQNSALKINVPLKANCGDISVHTKQKKNSGGGEFKANIRKEQIQCPTSSTKKLGSKENLPVEYYDKVFTTANFSVDKYSEQKHTKHSAYIPEVSNSNNRQRNIRHEISEPIVKYNHADLTSKAAATSHNNYRALPQKVSSKGMLVKHDHLQQSVVLQNKVAASKVGLVAQDLKTSRDNAGAKMNVKNDYTQRRVHFSNQKCFHKKEHVQPYSSPPVFSQLARTSDQTILRDSKHQTERMEDLKKDGFGGAAAQDNFSSDVVSENPGTDLIQQPSSEECSVDVRRRYTCKCCCVEKIAADSSISLKHHIADPNVVSYGLVAGVKFRQGTQDDMALCSCIPAMSSRVRRHASIVLLRHSLIETSSGGVAPLSVWKNHRQDDADPRRLYDHPRCERKQDDTRYSAVPSRSDGKPHSTGSAQQRDAAMQTRDDAHFSKLHWHTPTDPEKVVSSVHNVKHGSQLKRQQYL